MEREINNKIVAEDKSNLVSLPSCGVLIENHHHGQDFRTGKHAHQHSSMIYVVSGRGRCIIDQHEYQLQSNTAIMLKQGQLHQLIDKPGKPMVVYILYFSPRLANIDARITQPPLTSNAPLTVPIFHARQIRATLRQMLYEQNNRGDMYDVAICNCLAAVLLQLYRIASSRQPTSDQFTEKTSSTQPVEKSSARVNAVLDHIDRNYYKHHSLSDAARMAQMSQRQFTSLCRNQTGNSFVQFVNSIRTQKAKGLLETTSLAVSAVAFEVGYEELSTFYRAFKRQFSSSPLSFRKQS